MSTEAPTLAERALLAVARTDEHAYSCDHLQHYRNCVHHIPFRHTKKWTAARDYARRTAPACDCYMRQVHAALTEAGIPWPSKHGDPQEWLENGPDFGKDEV